MSSEKFKLILLFEEIHYGVLLPTDVNYRNLVRYVKKKFKVDDNKKIQLSYNVGSSTLNLFDDDHVHYFVHEVCKTVGVKKLTIKVEENAVHVSSSSNSKPLDIDLNECMSPDQDMVYPNTPYKFIAQYIFNNKETCMYDIGMKCLSEGYQFKVVRSCPERYAVECVHPECYWYIFTHKVKGSIKFKVTNINDVHTCHKTQFNPYHRNAIAKLLGKLILPKLKDVTRVYRPNDSMFDMNFEWNVYVSYKRAWKAKQLALTANYGCPIESFSELPIYCHN
ncbi:hypothetical protein Tco_0747070 [Tanacetum coccineum]